VGNIYEYSALLTEFIVVAFIRPMGNADTAVHFPF
jgi:hypothetical protein